MSLDRYPSPRSASISRQRNISNSGSERGWLGQRWVLPPTPVVRNRWAGAEWLRRIGRALANTLHIPSSNVSATPVLVSGGSGVSRSRIGIPERSSASSSRPKIFGGSDRPTRYRRCRGMSGWRARHPAMEFFGGSNRLHMSQIAFNVTLRRIPPQIALARAAR